MDQRPKATPSRNPLLRVLQAESPSQARKAKVVAPKQQKDNSPIPTAASRWKQDTLTLLNATYPRHEVTPFNFEGMTLPDELQQSTTTAEPLLTIAVDRIVEDLANTNNSNDITATFEFRRGSGAEINEFAQFYDHLTQIFRRDSGPDTDSETSSPHVPPVFPSHLRPPFIRHCV